MLPIPEHTRGQDRDTTPVAPGFEGMSISVVAMLAGKNPGVRGIRSVLDAFSFPPFTGGRKMGGRLDRDAVPVALGFHPERASRRNAGFSLTEVLVASAIFITVFSGVVLLYQGAVSTVLQGRQAIAAFEQARGSLAVLERDLKRAFTQRDAGDNFQFYGRPEGLMMVGALPNGGLGRITYVVSPAASNTQFETTLTEPWDNVMANVRRVAFDAARNAGLTEPQAQNLANIAEDQFSNPAFGGYPATGAPAFNVRVTTQSLLRLQESDVASLDAFPRIPKESLVFPTIDNSIDANLLDTAGFANEEGGDSTLMARYILQALNPTVAVVRQNVGNVNYNADLRQIVWNMNFNNDQAFGIDRFVIDALVASRKRQAYIDLLVQAPEGIFFENALAFWDSPLQRAQFTNFTAITSENPLDYVVTENILRRAQLLRSDTGAAFQLNLPAPVGVVDVVDALNTPGIFAYSLTAEGTARQYINDNSNIPGYADFRAQPGIDSVRQLSQNIERSLGGIENARYEGTPLAPRLPAVVHAGFWLVFEKPTAGSPDFRRWFTQIIEVPSAATRTAPNRMTPNSGPGASPVAL